MSNSALVNYTKLSPHCTKRTKPITKITIHHMAGNLSVETCGNVFCGTRKASSNYGIGTDGRVGLYVEESSRSYASSSADNDNSAVTIEVANCGGEPEWKVSDEAYNKLVDLCVDICQRNGIKELKYTGDKSGTLTIHKMFKATACPGPYLESRMSEIARTVTERVNAHEPQREPIKAEPIKNTPTTEKSENKACENAQRKVSGLSNGKTLTVKAKNGLNMRTGAGATKPLIKTLPKGTKVKWYGYYSVINKQTWYLVTDGKTNGYCLSNYLG